MNKIADISHHQGTIDWSKASKDLSLVIIRTKYGSNTTDRQYKANVAGAQKYKVPYGLYHYAQFVSESDAIQEAKDFLKTAIKEAKFLVLDVEEQTCKSVGELVKATQAFIDYCKTAGYKVGLYTGHHFYKPYQMDTVKADFLWIPRYGKDKPSYSCDLWQYTDKGSVAGIVGNVDLNVLNGTKTLEWFTQNNAQTVKDDESVGAYKPSNAAMLNATATVLARLENKENGISPVHREKLLIGELSLDDAIGLIYAAIERGLIVGK